jgi:alkylation response protein AidB-like acyl-CoA dehydrogenase
MPAFELPEELEAFRWILRELVEREIAPHAARLDATDEWDEGLYPADRDRPRAAAGVPRSA